MRPIATNENGAHEHFPSYTIGTMGNVSSKTKITRQMLFRIKHYIGTHVCLESNFWSGTTVCCIFGRFLLLWCYILLLFDRQRERARERCPVQMNRLSYIVQHAEMDSTITQRNNNHFEQWTMKMDSMDTPLFFNLCKRVYTSKYTIYTFALLKKGIKWSVCWKMFTQSTLPSFQLLYINNVLLMYRKRQFKHFWIAWLGTRSNQFIRW